MVALSDGHVATILFSELELIAEQFAELMRKFNVQMAKAAVEEELADSGLYLEDIEGPELQRQINSMLSKQARHPNGIES